MSIDKKACFKFSKPPVLYPNSWGIIFNRISRLILTSPKTYPLLNRYKKWHTCEEGRVYHRILFGIHLGTWKTNIYLKSLLKWVNKKQDNCDIYYVAFKKMKKNTCGYHYQNLNDMIYSSWVTEQNRMKLVVLGQFLPFYPLKSPKDQNFEKMKFTHVPKITIIWFETDRIFFILRLFSPFYHTNDPENQN